MKLLLILFALACSGDTTEPAPAPQPADPPPAEAPADPPPAAPDEAPDEAADGEETEGDEAAGEEAADGQEAEGDEATEADAGEELVEAPENERDHAMPPKENRGNLTPDPEEATADAGEDGAEGDAAEEETEAPEEPAAPPAPTVTYDLSGGLYVIVYKDPDTAGAGLSHDHAVKATGWSGSARWNADDPGQCSVNITVPTSGLSPDQTSVRQMFGLDGELSDSQREQVKDSLLGKSQLNGSAHPNITFASTSCAADGDKVAVTGDLTIRGQAKRVTVSLATSADGSSFSASGSFRAKATDFGFEPYSAMLGALKNKNTMKFVLDVSGSP